MDEKQQVEYMRQHAKLWSAMLEADEKFEACISTMIEDGFAALSQEFLREAESTRQRYLALVTGLISLKKLMGRDDDDKEIRRLEARKDYLQMAACWTT